MPRCAATLLPGIEFKKCDRSDLRRISLIGKAADLKSAGLTALRVRVLHPPPTSFFIFMQHPKLSIPYALLDSVAQLSRAAELLEKCDNMTFSSGTEAIYQMKFKDGRPTVEGTLYASSTKCHESVSNALMAASIIEPYAKEMAAWTRQMCRMTAYLLQDHLLQRAGKPWTKEGLTFLVADRMFNPTSLKNVYTAPGTGTMNGTLSEVFSFIGLWWPTEDGSKLEYLPPERSSQLIYELRATYGDKEDYTRGC